MDAVDAPDKQKTKQLNRNNIMKCKFINGLIAAGLLLGGMALSTFAGNGPGNGQGYGGPPKSDEARAARQAECLERNGGLCPNGGPRVSGERRGKGPGNGQGQGWRRGARDGTGPRAGTGNCPLTNPTPAQQ